MSRYFNLFFSKTIAQLEAYKALLTDEKEIAEVQASIDALKAKEAEEND